MKSAELFEIAARLQKAERKDPSLRQAVLLVRKAAWVAWQKEKAGK